MPSSSRPDSPPRPGVRFTAILGLLILPVVLAGAGVRPLEATRAAARFRILLDGGRPFEAGEMALQRTLSGCGPTALHNLLLSLEVPSPGPAALGRMSGTGFRGTSLAGLVRSARALGVPLRPRRPSARELLTLRTPYLAWLGEGHFVTVLGVDATGRLLIHDPGVGGYRLSFRAFRRRWGGVVADLEVGRSIPSAVPGSSNGPGIHSPSDRR